MKERYIYKVNGILVRDERVDELPKLLNEKQDKLKAGKGIIISEDNIISAIGGGGVVTDVPAATQEQIGGFKLPTEEERKTIETTTRRVVALDENNIAYVDLPDTSIYAVNLTGGLEVVNGEVSIKPEGVENEMIKSVSTDKLIQGSSPLILDSGTSAI